MSEQTVSSPSNGDDNKSGVSATTTATTLTKPAAVGSILGTRSQSGTMLNLQATGSFEASDGEHPAVVRFDTNAAAVATSTDASSQQLPYRDWGSNDGDSGSGDTPSVRLPRTPTNSVRTMDFDSMEQQQQNPPPLDDEPDEELQRAMAMALAIQKHPHLSPAEIQAMVGGNSQTGASTTATSTVSPTAAAKPALTSKFMSGRLSNMFNSAVTTNETATAATTTATILTASSGFTSFRERVVGRKPSSSTNAATAASAAATTAAASNNGSESSASDLNFNSSSNPMASAIQEAMRTAVVTATKSDPFHQQRDPPVLDTAKRATATTTLTPPNIALPATTNRSDTVMTTSKTNTNDAGPTAPTVAAATATTSFAQSSAWAAPQSSPSLPARTATTTATVSAAASTTVATESRPNALQSLLKPAQSLKSVASSASTMNVTATTSPSRLSTVAWKRRGGMGKYSTSAWERRLIALHGTKLLYFRQEDDNNAQAATTPQQQHSTDDDEATVVTDSGGPPSKRNAGTGGSANWFESAGLPWATTSVNSVDSSGASAAVDSITPRGSMDLVKEKATVHAAFGHSGAPSPFALSIKVRGETKWKLCFDRHATQMQWLSAISDVVVQSSVDTYNASLLEAVDPANHSDFTLFQPPIHKDGAATRETTTSGHRLWMLESYRVTSHDQLEEDDSEVHTESYGEATPKSDEKSASQTSPDQRPIDTEALFAAMAQELDHAAAQKAAKENAQQAWMIPEDNIWRVAALINVALVLARASSTSITGFWYIVVFVNFGIVLCLAKHPTWESLLGFVQAVPNLQILQQATQSNLASTVEASSASRDVKPTTGSLASPTLPDSKVAAAPKQSYLPVAGCTTVKLKEPTDSPRNEKGEMFAGWCTVPGEILAVRSHGYSATKQKVPSPGELYECVHVDIFESPHRYPDMATRVKLPKVPFADDGPKTWRSPDVFIISIALPTDPPKMTKTSSDGGGYTVTMYYQMKQETRDILRRVTADGYDPSKEVVDDVQKSSVNAVRLLEEWIRRAPTDHKFQSRFKVVPNAHNLTEIGMPGWIGKYNGKPFLIKRPGVTGFLYVHPELSCVEFDISLHPFPYLAKQGICYMKESYFKRVLVSFGFVIEGRTDDELPECLIGLMQLCYPDPQYAIQASDFFGGTAPRSF